MTNDKSVMDKPTILLQLDTDDRPSVFDRIVAIDVCGTASAELWRDQAGDGSRSRARLHLHARAEGSETHGDFHWRIKCRAGERVREAAQQAMLPEFGLQVSILLDSSGANTTAAAAVRAAGQHLEPEFGAALILGGTGPVGQRVARLLAGQRAHVRVGSRQIERAEGVCAAIREQVPGRRSKPSPLPVPRMGLPPSKAGIWSLRPARRASCCCPKSCVPAVPRSKS